MKIMNQKKEKTTKYLILKNTQKSQIFKKKVEF